MALIMRNPGTKQIIKRIRKLERHLNKLKMVPATRRRRSFVILPLVSKALTVSRAICALVDAGFPAEAFATSRTLLEILFSLRYITNKFTEERAEKYLKYQARVNFEWMNIAKKHLPKIASKMRVDPQTVKIAGEFESRGNWTGVRAQTWVMATEEDTFELDAYGKQTLIVFNKIDNLPNRELVDSYLKRFPGSVAISARTGEGINNLVQALEEALSSWRLRSRFRIPANESALIAEIHRVGHVLELRYEGNDALLVAHVPPDLAQKLERYAVA